MLRDVAVVCGVRHLLDGEFVESSLPSKVVMSVGEAKRVNLIGLIVGSLSEGFILDDGSGRIALHGVGSLNVGDVVLVIGRPRKSGSEVYVAVEIFKRLGSPKWLEWRRKYLDLLSVDNGVSSEKVVKSSDVSTFDLAVSIVDELDSGRGADVDEVVKRLGLPNAERIVNTLLERGEIFELTPGRVKVLR